MEELQCITIEQPYASAIIYGGLRVYTRPYSPALDETVGCWLAVHAPGTPEVKTEDIELVSRQWEDAPRTRSQYPRGAFLGAVHIGRVERCKAKDQNGCGAPSPGGHWCMVLVDKMIPLAAPLAYGAGGEGALWEAPEQIKSRILSQIPDASTRSTSSPSRWPDFPSLDCQLEHSAIYSALSHPGYRMARGSVHGMVAIPVTMNPTASVTPVGAFKVDRSPPAGTKMMRVVAHRPREVNSVFAEDLSLQKPELTSKATAQPAKAQLPEPKPQRKPRQQQQQQQPIPQQEQEQQRQRESEQPLLSPSSELQIEAAAAALAKLGMATPQASPYAQHAHKRANTRRSPPSWALA